MRTTTLDDLTQAHAANQNARDFSRLILAHGLSASMDLPVADVVAWLGHKQLAERLRQKAAVAGHGTTNLGELAGDIAARSFLTLLARRTVLGRLSGTLAAPANHSVPTPATDPTPVWLEEGRPMPLSRLTFSDPRTAMSKYAVLMAFMREWFRLADELRVSLIERVTLRALTRAEDTLLLSADAATAGAPAGLLNGLSAVGSGSPASIADIEQLWRQVSDGDPMMPYFVVSPRGAMHLAALNVDGEPTFPNISPATGGDIAGVPVLLSRSAGSKLILVDASLLAVADEGLDVGRSDQAAIEFLDNPTNNSATATPTTMVSAFQANATILRFVRWVHWTKLTTDCVAFLELPIAGSPS
jgi:hypothetical protein